jgi:hypothetical protein
VVTIKWSKLSSTAVVNFFAGMPLNENQQFQCTTDIFLYLNTKSDSRDELYNVASNAAYYQIYVAYISFIFSYFYSFLLRPHTSKQWLEYQ